MKYHNGFVQVIILSDDANVLYSAGKDKDIVVWDLETKKPKYILKGHNDWIYTMCISKDCNILYSGGYDKKIIVWDLKNVKKLY